MSRSSTPKLSVCTIVRNEEEALPLFLKSLEPYDIELCIVDTGSTDKTVEIAQAAGARVECIEWKNDFAAARNHCLAMATGEWILVLDADEYIMVESFTAHLEDFMAVHANEVGSVRIVNRNSESSPQCMADRFFPRHLGLQFEGRCGDRLNCSSSIPTGIEVTHNLDLQRIQNNRATLEAIVAEEPENPAYQYALGCNYCGSQEFDAALDCFSVALEHVEPEAAYLPHLSELACECLRHLGRSEEGLGLLRTLSPAWPNRADTRFLEGCLALDVGELELAEGRLQQCLELPVDIQVGRPSTAMARKWGPAYHLGVLRECLGMTEDAREYYEKALELCPEHVPSREALARL